MTHQSAVHAAWQCAEAARCADAEIAAALAGDEAVVAAVCDPSETDQWEEA